MTRVAYVTGGSRGAGHLVRGLAIGRALERASSSAELTIFAPIEPPFPALREPLSRHGPVIAPVDPQEVLDPERAPASRLARELAELDPDLVVVDMFWAPMRYILPELDAEAWLLLRSCPPVWLRGNDRVRFDAAQFGRVVAIEPIEADAVTDRIDPVVICNPNEVRTREELCRRFSLPADRPVRVVSHAGLAGEIDGLTGQGDGEASMLYFDLYAEDALFPLAPWVAAADEIHCSAGYNSYWEAIWLGYAARTALTVFRRQIDDPLWRTQVGADYEMRENGADVLARWIG